MITINTEQCVGCGRCEYECFRQCIDVEDGKAQWEDRNCTDCGHCYSVCPKEAITVENYPEESFVFTEEELAVDTEKLRNLQKSRRSLRRFSEKSVDKEIIETLIDSARYASTGRNLQDLSFVVIQDQMDDYRTLLYAEQVTSGGMFTRKLTENQMEQIKEQVKQIPNTDERITYQAPLAIGIVGDRASTYRGVEEMAGAMVGLAAANIEHVANSMGIGVTYAGSATQISKYSKTINEFLGLEKNQELMLVMLLGYPDEKTKFLRTAPRLERNVIWK